jgi:hypothetical protein
MVALRPIDMTPGMAPRSPLESNTCCLDPLLSSLLSAEPSTRSPLQYTATGYVGRQGIETASSLASSFLTPLKLGEATSFSVDELSSPFALSEASPSFVPHEHATLLQSWTVADDMHDYFSPRSDDASSSLPDTPEVHAPAAHTLDVSLFIYLWWSRLT